MISLVSRIRGVLGGVPRLVIAGIAAVLLGLPATAGATFLHPSEISLGDLIAGGSLPSCDDSLTFRDFHDFFERAAQEFDFHRLLSFLDDFEHGPFHGTDHFRAMLEGLEKPPWIEEALDGKHGWIGASSGGRPFCELARPHVIPEPETGLLLVSGLIGLAFAGRKRRF